MPGTPPQLIRLRGVRVHNLKNLDLDLPRGRLIVLTGVSGSGKSSLAFDTLYAEGQRRYIETFSAYTRQFLEIMDKPDADLIAGLPPAIAVGQARSARKSNRSTVASITEIQDFLAILYARLGRVVCRVCGHQVRPANPTTVIEAVDLLPVGTRYQIGFPVQTSSDTNLERLLADLREEGFVRVRINGQPLALGDETPQQPESSTIEVIVDRLVRGSEDLGRRHDSIETAFVRGMGRCVIITDADARTFLAGWRCSSCGADYHAPEPNLFRPNSPVGACPACEGLGLVADLDLDRIAPDRSKTLRKGAIAPWTTPAYRGHLDDLLAAAPGIGLPVDVPFKRLTPDQVQVLLDGTAGFTGLREFFEKLERRSYRLPVRVFLSRWRRHRPCPECGGARLRPEALAVRLGEWNAAQFIALTVREAFDALDRMALDDDPIGRQPIRQVRTRLAYLDAIGLGYLTLDRRARTLSSGEDRRVALASVLGSGLVNMLYVIDEPTIGLHPTDVDRLVSALLRLKAAGNTVLVVEHESQIIEKSDVVVDLGPGAGDAGGTLLFVGPPGELKACESSRTGAFLAGRARARLPFSRRPTDRGRLELLGAAGNNLKSVDAVFPLGVFCVVTGVSGAGKSTLVEETLYPALSRRLKGEFLPVAPHRGLRGTAPIHDVVMVDQSPIGRTARSNPATYSKAYDEIRKTFAATHEARVRHLGPGAFSFNVEGGRCSVCEGTGYRLIDMQYLPDVLVRCPECHGARFRPEILEVTYRGKSIAEVLEFTVRGAFSFFRHRPKVQSRLRSLIDVGLDYLKLGQPATTLSGGEAQRLKLASFLASSAAAITRSATGPKTLFILDEPTTGLHPADTLLLLDAFNRLVDLGHSLVVVEHHLDVIASADWVIELGPGLGAEGARILVEGTPETVSQADTPTGHSLARMFPQLINKC